MRESEMEVGLLLCKT